jgi:regulator of sirC expression with transglutaminase-like and TPR domain
MSLRDDFAAVLAAGPPDDLARGALTVARIGHPALDPAPHLARLDALAAVVRPRLGAALSPADAGRTVAGYLFRDLGFRGNQDDYYDPANSFLNDVLERRTGIPISLSLLLIEIARRLGLPAEGVGFPGHFLVRIDGVLLDPFFGGHPVGRDELVVRYRTMSGNPTAALPDDALAPADHPAILARMLRNLVRTYLHRQAHPSALAAVDLLLVLVPDAPEELRLRGLVYEQLDCPAAALADLRRYLALCPDADDADTIRDHVVRLSRAAVTIH